MKEALDKAIERRTQFMGFEYHLLFPVLALVNSALSGGLVSWLK